jgi:hypothetical protein
VIAVMVRDAAIAQIGTDAGIGVAKAVSQASPPPSARPTAPPQNVNTAASTHLLVLRGSRERIPRQPLQEAASGGWGKRKQDLGIP